MASELLKESWVLNADWQRNHAHVRHREPLPPPSLKPTTTKRVARTKAQHGKAPRVLNRYQEFVKAVIPRVPMQTPNHRMKLCGLLWAEAKKMDPNPDACTLDRLALDEVIATFQKNNGLV